jgi:opacity protein-like surface antigen
LGLGVAVRSGKNMYYQLEWMQSKYQDKLLANCTEKLGGNTLSFGVGYKF